MAAITIGAAAITRITSNTNTTLLNIAEPANGTGTLTSFEIFLLQASTSAKIGTFSGSSSTYSNRDYESFGEIAANSKQTFTGLNCNVVTDDLIGCYISGGYVARSTSGGSGVLYKAGDQFDGKSDSYSTYTGDIISLYGTGATAEVVGHPTMKRWGGIPFMRLNKGVF